MVKRCVVLFVVIQTKLDIHCKDFQMKQIWSNNGLNLFKQKEPISSSRSNILLFVAVIFLPIVKKGFMVEMGLQKKKKTSSWCCTDDSGPARSKLGKKRPTHFADGEDSDVADRTKKRPRKISALQKLEVNRISTKLIYTETFSIYWKIIGRPVSQEPALSPINMIKTLACLNLCMSLKHVLKKENSLTSVFNSIWNFVGST